MFAALNVTHAETLLEKPPIKIIVTITVFFNPVRFVFPRNGLIKKFKSYTEVTKKFALSTIKSRF